MLAAVQHPSGEPYWKLRYKGACHDIFFLTIYDKLPDLISVMYDAADAAGYPASDIGIYLQPIVQGVNCHCEFNLFYNPEDPIESGKVRELTDTKAVKKLMAKGAFFSRPYGKATKAIINNNASTIEALHRVKSMLDPNNIMNTGRIC